MVDPKQQLEQLLQDEGYSRVISLLTKEVMSSWNLPATQAHGIVLSAIGDPVALACIHEAWVLATSGGNAGLAALISRRRVLDLLRKDARRTGHSSLPPPADEVDDERSDSPYAARDTNAQAQLESAQFIQLMRDALTCFGAQGKAQGRQAALLRRCEHGRGT